MSMVEAPPRKVTKAAHIPDDVMLAAVAVGQRMQADRFNIRSIDDAWAMRWDVEAEVSRVMGEDVHWKITLAKARKLINQGRMDGCPCGCRGDYRLVPEVAG